MKKSDKKLDQSIIKALTEVCHWAQDLDQGFEWLTHQVNYQHFPKSLKITCVFSTHEAQSSFNAELLTDKIIHAFKTLDISIKPNQIHFDNEHHCSNEHQGDWARRLQRH